MSDTTHKNGCDPGQIYEEYQRGIRFKNSLGTHGMFEQNRINERFYSGDQWYGARCGSDRPLVRYNVIQRIGKYKMAMVGANPLTVNYTADGVPNTLELQERVRAIREQLATGTAAATLSAEEEINLSMSALSDYFAATAERVKLDDLKHRILLNAYKTGDGVLLTYWDERIRTGLYADEAGQCPVTGDIACEVLDIENVYFGDPTREELQEQPYILIAQRRSVADLRREARRFGLTGEAISAIRPDEERQYTAGQYGDREPPELQKAVVITKLWKEWDQTGTSYTVKAVRVTRDAVVRRPWDMGISLYPLARFSWDTRRGSAYGESEITWLIPNQIAINRMITANVWAVMMMGMPMMVVNGDVVTQPVTNDPGQIIRVFGGSEDVAGAIRYVTPPSFSLNFEENIGDLIRNTLDQAGANDAALGNLRPDNASAIVAVREAATMPMQLVQNRFYSFCEDVARIWADFWVRKYGRRSLKVEDENGIWYFPFDGERLKDTLISVRVDVGASSLWSESQSVKTLDNLFAGDVINVQQYLSRLPKGTVPNLNGLIRELQTHPPAPDPAEAPAAELSAADLLAALAEQDPESLDALMDMDEDAQNELIDAVTAQKEGA